jgi:hypothetical protein
LSSAILYLAIVAIWAGVLIPRWLRRDTSAVRTSADADDAPVSVPVEEPSAEEGRPVPGPVREAAAPERRRVAAPAVERRRVLSARRRLLGMLLVLVFGSAALAITQMAAWWVVLPPLVMLSGYMLLLREASKADAERRESAAAAGAAAAAAAARAAEARAQAQAPAARPVVPPRRTAPVPSAEIIELTARGEPESEQDREDLYDQYTDAKLRAVGDLSLSWRRCRARCGTRRRWGR